MTNHEPRPNQKPTPAPAAPPVAWLISEANRLALVQYVNDKVPTGLGKPLLEALDKMLHPLTADQLRPGDQTPPANGVPNGTAHRKTPREAAKAGKRTDATPDEAKV